MSLKKVVLSEDLTPLLLGEVPGFRTFWKEVKNPLAGTKKNRLLHDPNRAMRIIHRRVINALRELELDMPYATACRPGDSPLKNVARHRGNRHFVLLDLTDAFRNVQPERLAEVFRFLDPELKGHEKAVKTFLEHNITSPTVGGVAQGAPASPDLFNIYCALLLDPVLGALCGEQGFMYTRYLDDITISARRQIRIEFRRKVRETIEVAGFQVKDRKAKVQDLRQTGSIIITGVALRANGEVFIPRSYTKYVKELLSKGAHGDLWLLPKISGAMGTFLTVTSRAHPNDEEAEILKLHRTFQRLIREQRRLPV